MSCNLPSWNAAIKRKKQNNLYEFNRPFVRIKRNRNAHTLTFASQTYRERVISKFFVMRLQNEEPHNLYSSLNISSTIQRSRIRWAGHAALTGEMTTAYILARKPKRKRNSGKLSRADRKTTFRCSYVRKWARFIWLLWKLQ